MIKGKDLRQQNYLSESERERDSYSHRQWRLTSEERAERYNAASFENGSHSQGIKVAFS